MRQCQGICVNGCHNMERKTGVGEARHMHVRFAYCMCSWLHLEHIRISIYINEASGLRILEQFLVRR